MNTELTTIDFESLAEWSTPKLIETKRGWKNLRTGPITDKFWTLWRIHKPELSAAGISCRKDEKTNKWEATWWMDPPGGINEKLQDNLQASQAQDSTIDFARPEGLDYLGYQKAGIAFALNIFEPKYGSIIPTSAGVLIGDEMGLGKTIQAIGIVNAVPAIKKILIICPASLKVNWYRELKRWLVRPMRAFIAQGNTGFPDFADIIIINFDILTKFPRELTRPNYWDLVVVDEAHFIKGDSQRAKAVKEIPAARRLCLTGTPIPNRAKELFNVVNWLQPEIFPNFYKFLYKYCGGAKEGVERLVALQTKLRSTCMVRRLKRDVLTELPAKQRQVIEIASDDPSLGAERDLVSGHEAELHRLQAALELAKVSDSDEAYHAALKALQDGVKMSMGEMAKARHETAVAKIPYVISHLETCMEGGNKIVFFAHHRDVIEAIYSHFRTRAVLHYGGLDDSEKQSAVDNFQNDPAILLFTGSIKASGVGITLTASSHVVFGEIDWVPGNMSQCEDRTHRLGQRESVLVQHLVLEGSIDATMAKALVEKQAVADVALDVDRDKLMVEPIVPTARTSNTRSISVKRSEVEEQSLLLKQATIVAIHQCLKALAGVCDGAHEKDGMGFNGVDTIIGKSLAMARFLTPRQAVLGQKLVRKYRKQLPEDSYVTALQKAEHNE